MLKKNEIGKDDEEEESNKRRIGGKFSGLGTKMEKLFRSAFRKDNINQSRPQPPIEMIEESNESESRIENNVENRRKRMMERSQAVTSSEFSSDIDFGSRTNLAKEQTKSNESIHEVLDEVFNKKTPMLNTRKIRKLKRSEHIQSDELPSRSMNVVVDIHRENFNAQSPKSNKETVVNIFSDDHESENDLLIVKSRKKSLDASLENCVDSMKKQRKRWSKEASVILPPKRNSLSSTSVSQRSSNWIDVDATAQPVAAPRLKNIISDNEGEKNDCGLDNAAFEHENDDMDQVLTIETEYDSVKRTKVEMRSTESETDGSNRKPNASMDNEKFTDHSGVSDIEEITEIRRLSSEDAMIDRKIHSEIESGILTERGSSSVLSGAREKKISRRHSKSISITEKSTSSMSDMQVTDEFPKREEIITRNKINKRRTRSTSSSYNSNASEMSKITRKSTKSHKKINKKREKLIKDGEKEIKYISITIHRADVLVSDYIIRHPMVMVHIIEESSGNYLKVPNKVESVYLQPLITGMYDFKANKSMIPYWDEELIFEHDFNAILNADKDQVLILFEIVDLPSVANASSTYDRLGGHDCWYKIAWAFLKPMSATGICHIDKVVRLQLYKPKRSQKKMRRHHCEPYRWWKSGFREKYSSTLFVTVTSIDPPKLEPVFYGDLTLNEMPMEQIEPSKSITITTETGNLSRWSRLAAQSCKIPNEIFFKTETTDNGCFYVIFSNNGKYLACATYDEYDYPIVVYKIDEEKVHIKFLGHKSFIYALDWSNNDEILLSVSSDQTARIWDIENKIIQEINMLPHPSYVYCGKFYPTNFHFIVTGCYDHVTRLWSRRKNSSNYELIQELDGHEGFVNSICFLKDGDFLTADSVGVIVQWTVKKRKGKLSQDWRITKRIKIREIKNITINTIVLHPLGSRLLVHSRDNGLRMLDLATGVVLQKYVGLKNSRIQIAAKISPCGGLLLCGGEDATLNIWSLESCKHIATYSTNFHTAAITCIDYHPYDHVLVYSIFGVATEAIVLRYDKQSTGESVGLKLLTIDKHNSQSINDIESVRASNKSNQRFPRRLMNDSIEFRNERLELNQSLTTNITHDDLRSKLRLFNDSERQLKTRSANRLTSIIAKIDKILSNSESTHRTSYDIEANRLDNTSYQERTVLNSFIQEDEKIITRPYVPPLFSTSEDNSSYETQSNTVEMTDLGESKHITVLPTRQGKSNSARDHHQKVSERHGGEDTKKTMSDSAMNPYKKSQKSNNKRHIVDSSKVVVVNNSVTVNPQQQSSPKDGRDESSAESGGTYVLEKSDIGKIIESESSSVRSDVTFVIESEKPVPKPRRKRPGYRQDTIVQIE